MIAFFRHHLNSIAVRVVLVIVSCLLAIQLLTLSIVQFPAVFRMIPNTFGEEANAIAELVWMLENVPPDLEPYVLSIHRGAGRNGTIGESFPEGAQSIPGLRQAFAEADTDAAGRLVNRQILFKTSGFQIMRRLFKREDRAEVSAAAVFIVAVELSDGRVLTVELAPYLYLTGGSIPAILLANWLILAVVQSVAVALVMMKPVRALERDAERVGLTTLGESVTEHGPAEFRRINRALNKMRARLAGLVQERQDMIAAIAHDIRTGITKIRLRTYASDAVKPEEIEGDLAQMEALIADMLTYARAEHPQNDLEEIDLAALLEKLSTSAPLEVSFENQIHSRPVMIWGDRRALERLFDNLLENARRYGRPPIEILMSEHDGIEVRVRDHGDGISPDELEQVFQPFARGEKSRNRETGGSGLGLGIARAIARAHGGELHLKNRPGGGLDAIVHLREDARA